MDSDADFEDTNEVIVERNVVYSERRSPGSAFSDARRSLLTGASAASSSSSSSAYPKPAGASKAKPDSPVVQQAQFQPGLSSKTHAALAYSRGEHVEVWSNTKGSWIPATVEAVFVEAAIADGYSVQANTVKVISDIGVKWVVPDNVSTQLRKAPMTFSGGSSSSSMGVPGGSSGSASGVLTTCRNGCGRPVQPGLARGLRPYDTCCKRCAQHPGADQHDENCGQCRRLGPPGAASASGRDAHKSCKRLLSVLLRDPTQLNQIIRSTFSKVCKGGDTMDLRTAHEGVASFMSAFGLRKQDVPEAYLVKICDEKSLARSKLGVAEFIQLCRGVLEDKQEVWFPEILPVSTKNFVKKNGKSLQGVYEVGRKLGQGHFGEVFEVRHRRSGENRVCKRIAKSKDMDSKQILQEIGHMAMLDHPNVIKVYEYFDDDNFVCQIMEQCKGGELQDKVDEMRKTGAPSYDEAFICDVMKQVLRALAFMHKIKCLHKDLKPQNIMMVDRTSSSIKVIDFGLAELFDKTQEFASSSGGTLLYMAPEVFRQEMTTKVDVWSTGIILYNLLTGTFPFMETWPPPEGKDQRWWQERTMEKIKAAEKASHPRLALWSPVCLDLCWTMLRKDVDARLDATQCLEHKWFQRFSEAPPPLSVGVVQCVEAYARMSGLKQAIFLLIAHQCALDAIPELRALFTHFDYRNQGCLGASDLHRILVESGMGGLRAERVIHTLDRDKDGMILWTEFTAAAICVSVCRNAHAVDAAFFTIDEDGDRRISSEDLVRVLAPPDDVGQSAWKRRIPALFEEAMKAPVPASVKSSFMEESLKDLGDRLISGEPRLAQDKFRGFVGKKLDFRAGDALYAVT